MEKDACSKKIVCVIFLSHVCRVIEILSLIRCLCVSFKKNGLWCNNDFNHDKNDDDGNFCPQLPASNQKKKPEQKKNVVQLSNWIGGIVRLKFPYCLKESTCQLHTRSTIVSHCSISESIFFNEYISSPVDAMDRNAVAKWTGNEINAEREKNTLKWSCCYWWKQMEKNVIERNKGKERVWLRNTKWDHRCIKKENKPLRYIELPSRMKIKKTHSHQPIKGQCER